MALMKSNEVPRDAVAMDEMEATTYIWDVVAKWEHLADTWALRYGPAVLGSINAVSGILINNHFRQKLKLGAYGYLSSVIPISIMPGLLTALFHRHMVSTGMLLMKKEACPICYEVTSSAIQVGFGIAYPMVLAPTSALMFAHRYGTFRIPELSQGPKVMFQFLKKISKPLGPTLIFLGTIQLFTSSVLTYFEMKNNINLRRKMLEIENKMLDKEGTFDD